MERGLFVDAKETQRERERAQSKGDENELEHDGSDMCFSQAPAMCITSYWCLLRRQILLALFIFWRSLSCSSQNTYIVYKNAHTHTHSTYWHAPVLLVQRGLRDEAAAINTSLTFASPAVVGVIREMGGKELSAIGSMIPPHRTHSFCVFISLFECVCVCLCACMRALISLQAVNDLSCFVCVTKIQRLAGVI